ncbi:DEAD/DEAH box helicase family protein [Jiella sp. MQZ13P-4]|uniref:DEAD/DEAH box helicase family protein n=1 Tax=Jiella sonneratiae TaxID=2816856 RepID=A0ABS3J4Q1_9HYPH|nr:DEAD/DEAH box helicase family protein [Jiella sonneratiae]
MVTDAFWNLAEKQAHDRDQTLSPFNKEVAEAVLNGGFAALEDSFRQSPRYQVISAPTGSGKSSYAWALVGAVVQAEADSSALFLCETIHQCEDTYRELTKLVPPEHLAIWTGAHDAKKPLEDIQRDYGFEPSARFHANDLPNKRVVVATHAFYKGARGRLAMEYRGRDRTLTVVDERPKEVSVFDIDQGDVGKVRDWAIGHFGGESEAVRALRALHDYLGDAWEIERSEGGKNFRALRRSDLSWFTSLEAREVSAGEGEQLPARVVSFAQALSTGYAFMARYEGSSHGGRFVGYRMDLPIMPGTILLDATSDIDGVSSLVPWRAAVRSPQVAYDNLSVSLMAPPEEVVGPKQRLVPLLQSAKGARPYAEWIMETVLANSKPGEKVLAVVHKVLLSHDYLPDVSEFGEGAFDLEGRSVAFIHWGYGIGSNRWKEATSVFLFGEFHVPKRATVATTLGLLDQPAGSPRLKSMDGPNSQDDLLRLVRDGHLLRWEKQLAMRGNARNISADGVCGHQRLFVTSEFSRFMKYRNTLFPGATFHVDSSVQRRKTGGGAKGLAALLASTDAHRLTGPELRTVGINLNKDRARLLANPVVRQAMALRGWTYHCGGGRGKPSCFVRAEGASVSNDNAEVVSARPAA